MLSIFSDKNFWIYSLATAMGTIIASAFTAFFLYLVFNPFRQWLFKKDPRFSRILLAIFDFIYNPILWIIVFLALQLLIIFDIYRLLSVVLTSIIFLRFYFYTKFGTQIYPSLSSQFSDEFHKLSDVKKNWESITGELALDDEKGNPKPSLRLTKVDPEQATNTFLMLKEITSEKGEIECDFFLEQGALLNIVFMCDKTNHNWHMARYDSRGGTSDGFLIKDAGKGNNWRFNNMSTSRTSSGTWHKARVEFSAERARMFRNGELIAEIINPQLFGKYMGIFNECANVSVDNFKFSNR